MVAAAFRLHTQGITSHVASRNEVRLKHRAERNSVVTKHSCFSFCAGLVRDKQVAQDDLRCSPIDSLQFSLRCFVNHDAANLDNLSGKSLAELIDVINVVVCKWDDAIRRLPCADFGHPINDELPCLVLL